jgi:hypothetical protein
MCHVHSLRLRPPVCDPPLIGPSGSRGVDRHVTRREATSATLSLRVFHEAHFAFSTINIDFHPTAFRPSSRQI